jgi:hypothetical protein
VGDVVSAGVGSVRGAALVPLMLCGPPALRGCATGRSRELALRVDPGIPFS